jgi:hypothetical protein
MKKKSQKLTPAKFRKQVRKFNEHLLSNMKFLDRIKYCFTGNYRKPLEQTYIDLNRKGQIYG